MKSKSVRKGTRTLIKRVRPLTLVQRVERLEGIVLLPEVKQPAAMAGAARFTKLGADGSVTSADHVVVRDSKTGLDWTASPVGGKDLNHADAMKACSDLKLCGPGDWRAPTVEELLTLIDYTKYDPAVDKEFFKGPYGWTWTSTPYAADAGCAWLVNLNLGYSFWLRHGDELHVRAVRASQQLALGFKNA